MNLVAHQYLSFDQSDIQIGNYLGEVVKGNQFKNYPKSISLGILLHRAIDSYTDKNEIVKDATAYFHSTQHKYSPIVIDLMYDYFLIKHWKQFHSKPFNLFKEECYVLFNQNKNELPSSLKYMTEYLIKDDWFENYTSLEGIQKTLNGISKRAKFPNNLNNALEGMIKHQDAIENNFLLFMPKVINMSQNFIDNF